MVKVFGPMMSFDATGTLGKIATFSKWKGRNYVRSRVIPANPKSGLQTGMRSMFKFLSQQWSGMSAPDKATWVTLAEAKVVSPFNAYVSQGQLRWKNFNSPSQAYPAAEVGVLGTPAATFPSAAGGVSSITISMQLSAAADNWGFLLYRSTSTGFTPSLSNVIAVVQLASTNVVTFVDTPLDPDTYYYDLSLITNDGVTGLPEGEISATAT